MTHFKVISCLVLLFAVAGCSTSGNKQPEEKTSAKYEREHKEVREHLASLLKVPESGGEKTSTFVEQTDPTISLKMLSKQEQEAKEKEWLTKIRITLDPAKNAAVPMNAIIRMFREKGVNIVSNLPLDLYSYNGFGVTDVNAETALMVFIGAVGLDYDIDNSRQLVTIQPMKPKTWIFNIGNRRTSFSAGGDNVASSGQSTGAAGVSGTGIGGTSVGGVGGTGGTTTGQSATGISGAAPTGVNAMGISSSDDIWTKLSLELTQRLTILIPKADTQRNDAATVVPIVPGLTQTPLSNGAPLDNAAASASFASNPALYNPQVVGRFSINPETGAITVQAPKYILEPLDKYLTKVQEMYNTLITFEGELVTVTTTENSTKGIDWSSFNNFGTDSLVVQNNILGGAVITQAAGTTAAANALTIGNASIAGAGTLVGAVASNGKFAMFNSFLTSIGQLNIKDTPLVTTTSGTPVKFVNNVVRHYQQYQQTASASTATSSVATTTIDIPYSVGMTLRLNPRYDVNTGLVRTQYSLERSMISGWETKVNPITVGSTIQIINTQNPILANTTNDGELLLKNNDLIVVGGLTEDTDDKTYSGMTGFMDSPLKWLFGKSVRNKTTTTHYFALRVTIAKKD